MPDDWNMFFGRISSQDKRIISPPPNRIIVIQQALRTDGEPRVHGI